MRGIIPQALPPSSSPSSSSTSSTNTEPQQDGEEEDEDKDEDDVKGVRAAIVAAMEEPKKEKVASVHNCLCVSFHIIDTTLNT